MRIAICLFGQLRNFEKTFPSFKRYIVDSAPPGAEVDVFFCGHPNNSGMEHSLERLMATYAPKRYILREATSAYYTESMTRLWKDGHSKVIRDWRFPVSLPNFASHLRNKVEAVECVKAHAEERGVSYDVAMFVRPDVFFYSPIDCEYYVRVAENHNLIVIPAGPGGAWDCKIVNPVAVCDRFALGSMRAIEAYARLAYRSDECFAAGILTHPETYLGFHVKELEGLTRVHMPTIFGFDDVDGDTAPCSRYDLDLKA